MNRVFVINPQARGGRARSLWQGLRTTVGPKERVEHFGDPSGLVGQSFDEWVVVGGDGSVQRAVEVLMQAKDAGRLERLPVLRVLPLGTGGDYAKGLLAGEPVPADLGRVSLAASAGGAARYFANVASVGFSAQVAEAKERNPSWIPRGLAYLAPTLLQLRRAKPIELSVRSEDFRFEGRAWAVLICKGRWAGGGMRFGVDVGLSDGKFEVGIVEDFSVLELLSKLPQLYLGGLRAQPGVIKARQAQLVIEAARPLSMDLDGEPLTTSRADFGIVPASSSGLRVCRY